MKVDVMQLGLYQTNCYILYDEQTGIAAITDPGYTPELVLQVLAEKKLKLNAILLTHGHFDHVGGVKAIAEATGCRVFVNEREKTMPSYMTAGELFYTDTYDEGDEISFGTMQLRVMATPGHSPGSVCLIGENVILSGDTLFCGSCGRTDSPGGSWEQILASLKRLGELEGDYVVYPGQGHSTTLERERRGNRFMMEAMRQ